MKKDTEVKLLMQERRKGTPQKLAAARAGMSERTARKYERAGQLPSALKRPHDWQTRENPFEEDWEWVVTQLKRDPALQGSTLFALLCEHHPDRYRPTQLRTLQRHIQRWRAIHGPEQEVIFQQRHIPGERAQSDFTHMEDLGVTIAGEPFPHMVYHFVLTYSNVEAASISFSESFEALAEGIEKALWQIGGVPEQHRTDHLTAAVRQLREREKEDWTVRYHLVRHDIMTMLAGIHAIPALEQDSLIMQRLTYWLWIAHNLERVGDHCTNMCERIVFFLEGDGTIKPTHEP